MKILRLLLFIAICALNSVFGQHPIQSSIDRFAADAALTHASISFQVLDAGSGAVVAEYDARRTLPTASIAKLFSTAAALDILGPDYRPKTRIYHDGTIDASGVLHGNIWVRGGGDPSLGSKYFHKEDAQSAFFNDWIKALQAAGIRQINGYVVADASEFGYEGAPDGWTWSDLGNYYGAGPSGLSIFDNQLRYTFNVPSTPGKNTTLQSIEPSVPNFTFQNHILSSSKSGDNAYLYGAPFSNTFFGTGTLPAGSGSFVVKGSMPDPELQVAYEFDKALTAAGIQTASDFQSARQKDLRTSESDYAKYTLLYTQEGEKLLDVIYHTNMRSVNHFAEHMICMIGYAKTGNGSLSSGLQTLEKHWAGKFNADGLHVNDGSGLSRSNAFSAAHFAGLLKYMHTAKDAEKFKSTLPVAGVSGTLKNVCDGQAAHGKMMAKSGSMNRIKSYAGYIQSSTGKTYCFALIVNNYSCSNSAMLQKMESVFNTIATH
jgi:D-alanyl-D-alanine carboxypeptidase/D-alanyl-D-alanine-endopeptidase (penicillin-binding protein 4)